MLFIEFLDYFSEFFFLLYPIFFQFCYFCPAFFRLLAMLCLRCIASDAKLRFFSVFNHICRRQDTSCNFILQTALNGNCYLKAGVKAYSSEELDYFIVKRIPFDVILPPMFVLLSPILVLLDDHRQKTKREKFLTELNASINSIQVIIVSF